jgi:tRNA uridine 5-carboxymethylaminomethyl modification enzyme
MFTSRAEYRLMLREDNADLRLTAKGRELGLIEDAHWAAFERKQNAIVSEQQRLHNVLIRPENLSAIDMQETVLRNPINALEFLRRPEITYQQLLRFPQVAEGATEDPKVAEQVEIQVKYSGYIERQQTEIARSLRYEDALLPEDFDYHQISGLSHEVRQKLIQHRPNSVGQASRIQGVTPAAISLILVYLKKSPIQRQKTA